MANSPTTRTEKCAICYLQGRVSRGLGCWAWHRFCRAELNPVALVGWLDRMPQSDDIKRVRAYVVTVTGMTEVADHDRECEAELTSHGHTPCRCAERAPTPDARAIAEELDAIAHNAAWELCNDVDTGWLDGFKAVIRSALTAATDAARREIAQAADDFTEGRISSGRLAEILGASDKHGFKNAAHAFCERQDSYAETVEAARREEREACAKLVESHVLPVDFGGFLLRPWVKAANDVLTMVAGAIRARSLPETPETGS